MYKDNYDDKTHDQRAKVGNHTFLINPKYNTQSEKNQFRTFFWNSPYKFMNCFSHLSHIVRKTGTPKTQGVHLIRFRKFIPHQNVPHKQVDESQFYVYPDLIDDPELLHNEIPQFTPAAVSSDTGYSDQEKAQKFVFPLEPETI